MKTIQDLIEHSKIGHSLLNKEYSWLDVFNSADILFKEIYGDQVPNIPLKHNLPVAIKDVLLECYIDTNKFFGQEEFRKHTCLLLTAYEQLKFEGKIGYEGNNFAVFAYTTEGYGEEFEQLTNWNTLESAKKSKENWFQKERHTFILARIGEDKL